MTECVIVSKDGSTELKTIGIELIMPVVIKNQIRHVSISDYFLMYLCGTSTPSIRYGIAEDQLLRMNIYMIFLKEDFKRLEIMYINSSKPAYTQMLIDYLKRFYNLEHLHYWLKILSENFIFINMTLANCHSETEVSNKIPGLVNFLRLNADKPNEKLMK